MQRVHALIKVIIILSVGVWWLARVQQNRLPSREDIVSEVYQSPVQRPTSAEPFTLTREGTTYTITPFFEYQLYGLVVSSFNTSTWWNIYHRQWKDTLNTKDICLIWGHNIESGAYQRMKFTSTSFEVRYQARDYETWHAFKSSCLSNNHLLAADAQTERVIMDMHRGDQVFIRGFLVNYRHGEGFKRGTSTDRYDTGAWSCETIYVKEARIIKARDRIWRWMVTISMLILGAALVMAVILGVMVPLDRETL